VLTAEPELISWAQWLALVRDLGSALLPYATISSESDSQWLGPAAKVLLPSPPQADTDPGVPTLPEMTWTVDLHTLEHPVAWNAKMLLAALTTPDPAIYGPAGWLEVLDGRDCRHASNEFVLSQVCGVLPDDTTSIGIRVVDRDESQLPSSRHLVPLVDPKGRWIAKTKMIQMVVEACADPIAVVHASRMEREKAAHIAHKVLQAIFENVRAG
jgi:hypothetical protein